MTYRLLEVAVELSQHRTYNSLSKAVGSHSFSETNHQVLRKINQSTDSFIATYLTSFSIFSPFFFMLLNISFRTARRI